MYFNSPEELLYSLINSYYIERNIEAVMDCLTDDVLWIGTETDEHACGKEALMKILNKDMADYPDSFELEVDTPQILKRSDTWVTITAKGTQKEVPRKVCGMSVRGSVECIKTDKGWLICSIHTSVPNLAMEKLSLERQLYNEQLKLYTLMCSIPGGVAIYRQKKDGRITTDYVSEGLATMCGYTADEFLSVLKNDAISNIVPKYRGQVMKAVGEAITNKKPISTSYSVYSKTKEHIPLRLDANIIFSELKDDDTAIFYAVHTKVSDEAKKIIEEQKRYRKMMSNLNIAYFEMLEGGIFYASDKFNQYAFSYIDKSKFLTASQTIGMVHPDDVPVLMKFISDRDNQEPKSSATIRCKMVDGSYRWTEIMGIYDFNPNGKIIRQLVVLRDAENEWIEQNRRLQNALSDTTKANQSKTDFFSRVSHDIRTPLNAILGFTDLALEDKNDMSTINDYLLKIQNSGKYLLGLINDVLDMSKIESNNFELHQQLFNEKIFLNDVAEMFTQVAIQHEVKLVTDFSEATAEFVVSDELRNRQIFSNLLSNAIKFSGKGNVVYWTVKDRYISEDTVETTSTISDSGCGMSEAFLKKIFTPFEQERNIYSDITTGTGLGLSIVKNLIEQMNGSIKVESKLGIGSTFTIKLRRRTRHKLLDDKERFSKSTNLDILKGKRILLCEDQNLNTEIITKLLSRKNIIVETAENGKIGLEIFQASPKGYFQGILMDVRMPVMDGLTAAKSIRQLNRPDAATIPIIALTANAYAEDKKAVLSAGMNYHLTKPIDPSELYTTLVNFFK